MRRPFVRVKGSKIITNGLAAGVVMLSSLFVTAPALAATTYTVCSSGCSYTTIQDAVTAASAGDTIALNENQTVTTTVSLTKQLTIQAGSASTINTSGSNYVFQLSSGAAGSTINGLTFNKTDKTSQIVITTQANNVTISNNSFKGMYVFGDPEASRGLEVSSVSGLTVTGNAFGALRQPAYINNGATGTISNNFTNGTRGWVVESGSNMTFTGNTWGTSNTSGTNNQRNAIDIAIINNGPNNYPAIVAMSDNNHNASAQNQVTGTFSDVFVDDSASPGGNGYWQTPFQTITAGINAVAVGGTVYVAAGIYTESTVNINKSAILLGAQAGVDATAGRSHASVNESWLQGSPFYAPSFEVNADDVTIDGFDFGGLTDGFSSGPVGVDLGDSDGAVVTNSIFEHNQRGISLNGASNVLVSNVRVASNNANPENNAGIWGDVVGGITIQDSTFLGASNTAINLAGSNDVEIIDNFFQGNGNTAVIWNDTNVLFDGNTGSDFNGSGLFITGSTNVTVSDNDLSNGASFSGVSVSSASGPSSNVKITGNVITGFNRAVNVGAGALSDVLTVTSNDLSGNTTSGVSAPSGLSTVVNAVSNWWGSNTGPADAVSGDGSTPDTNPLGAGTAAVGAVNYSNWCVNAACTTPTTGGGSTGGGSSTGTGTSPGTTTGTGGGFVTVSSSRSRTSSGGSGSTSTGNASDGDQGEVLGTGVGISSTNTDDSDNGVAGVTTEDKKIQESKNFLGLGWWWIPIIIAALLLFLAWLRRRNQAATTGV